MIYYYFFEIKFRCLSLFKKYKLYFPKKVTRKEFKFAQKHNLPFYFVSAADGTNVVKVDIFLTKICFLS